MSILSRSTKMVYGFGGGKADGDASMRELLGGKGANLAEMARIGLPVPAGFTITTEVCRHFSKTGSFPEGLEEQVEKEMKKIEAIMEKGFGDANTPLLLSVRSGARASMPGMMDTVLNLGINRDLVKQLSQDGKNDFFAHDCYRRFVQMYGDVVLGLRPSGQHEIDPFEHLIERKKEEQGVTLDTELSAEDMLDLAESFKHLIQKKLNVEVPVDPKEQLWGAIRAVFQSWDNERAKSYRRLNHIPDHWGTAVNVQAMVFGNRGDDCGTGVAFTRNPSLGQNQLYGEFLMNAQGEDVVAGVRTPQPLSIAEKERIGSSSALEEVKPKAYQELLDVRQVLEQHFRDMQDLEFTIEGDKLWILQTRTGKRTGMAAVKIAIDMVEEGLIDAEEALTRIDPTEHLGQLLQPIFASEPRKQAEKEGNCLALGLAAGPGAATGRIVFSAKDAEVWSNRGEPVILARIETSPEDIRGMAVSEGILTARGGATSHAALVARQMGKVCVAGCDTIQIDYANRQMKIKNRLFKEGDWLSLDGFTGHVIAGRLSTQPSEVAQVLFDSSLDPNEAPLYLLFAKLMKWANEVRTLHVRCNADQPEQVKIARAFGAEGIGLCRTEHMFFDGKRINFVREMILSETEELRRAALKKLKPLQESDFVELFREMDGHPVTIRLLDPPLHEFLPTKQHELDELSRQMFIPVSKLRLIIDKLVETNPMLGHRGCRLLISYPEIAEMQTEAIISAAIKVQDEGVTVFPKIMVPLVSMAEELALLRKQICSVADCVIEEKEASLQYAVGSMIELPRACVTAGKIASFADFFSFGTNDLTQTSYGFSRDDASKFLEDYRGRGVIEGSPFQTLDQEGVGALIKIAIQQGRAANENMMMSICGEHGGDPRSIAFCHKAGLNTVSCSPYRIPIAILASAQAAIEEKRQG